jgi:hypothetical protein
MSGPIEEAKQVIREMAYNIGLCVTIEPTTFIYTGGEETGFKVGFINYPRFPKTESEIESICEDLMKKLQEKLFQDSALFMTPNKTVWVTRR